MYPAHETRIEMLTSNPMALRSSVRRARGWLDQNKCFLHSEMLDEAYTIVGLLNDLAEFAIEMNETHRFGGS